MSPILFNICIADLDRKMKERGIGGIALGKERIWSLAYADDIVLLAKNRVALKDMMDTLNRFVKERSVEVNAAKKVMVFNKSDREKKEEWKWKDKEIEEVKEFRYLGFHMNRKGDFKEHVKELGLIGKIAANRIWGLGERICKDDFGRRGMLFNYLVKSIIEYGVELWGWEERKGLGKIMMDYTRWVFKLDFCTPRYMIYRELGFKKMKNGD